MKQCFCTVDQLFLKPEGTFVAHKVLVIRTATKSGGSSRQPAVPPTGVVTPVEIVAGAVDVGAVVALARQTPLLDLLLDVDIAGSPRWRGGRLEVMAQECVACQCRVGRRPRRRRRRWVKGRRWFAMTYVWRQERHGGEEEGMFWGSACSL